jgi:hypothetical protein
MSGDPQVRFGGRGHRNQSVLPTPILLLDGRFVRNIAVGWLGLKPFVDPHKAAQPAKKTACRIGILAMPPKSQAVPVPGGDFAEGLHRNNATAAEILGEFTHDR